MARVQSVACTVKSVRVFKKLNVQSQMVRNLWWTREVSWSVFKHITTDLFVGAMEGGDMHAYGQCIQVHLPLTVTAV